MFAPRDGRLVGTPIAAFLPEPHHALRWRGGAAIFGHPCNAKGIWGLNGGDLEGGVCLAAKNRLCFGLETPGAMSLCAQPRGVKHPTANGTMRLFHC